jgi:hypothetical protein
MNNDSPRRIIRSFIIFAVVHSLLASRQAKAATSKLFGQRSRNGLYRIGFNAYSVVWFIPAAIWFQRLPDRDLYRVPPPWSYLMRLTQLGALAMAIWSARIVGVLKITGIKEFLDFGRGSMPEAEPEAQGPVLTPDEKMSVVGPFRISRHPLNLAPLGIFFFFPRMTVNRALLAMLSALYLIIGSLHEEQRLQAAYGNPYENYQRSHVPFYFPNIDAIKRLLRGGDVE